MKIVWLDQSEDSEVTILNVFTLDLPPPPRIPVSSEGLYRDSLLIICNNPGGDGHTGWEVRSNVLPSLYFYVHVQCTIFYPYPWIKHELQIRRWFLCFFHLLTFTFGKWSNLTNCRCFFVRWKPPTSWLDSLMARGKFSWPPPRWFSKGILQNLMKHQMISLPKSPVQVQNPLNSDLGTRK